MPFRRHLHRRRAEALPPARRPVRLRHHEGQTIEEIGRQLGLEPSATKNSIFRAVQKLRRALEPLH
ncbi:MAG: RNA polymerase sigma factor, partial [Candidatus Methylomirabilales bacterium]